MVQRINTIRMNTLPCNKVVSQTWEFKLKSNEKEHFQIQSDNRTSTKLSLKLSFKTLFLEKRKSWKGKKWSRFANEWINEWMNEWMHECIVLRVPRQSRRWRLLENRRAHWCPPLWTHPYLETDEERSLRTIASFYDDSSKEIFWCCQ